MSRFSLSILLFFLFAEETSILTHLFNLFLFLTILIRRPIVFTRSTALGSALLAGSAIGFAGWDVANPETLKEVNTKGSTTFSPKLKEDDREKGFKGWKKAIQASAGWDVAVEED